MSTTYWSIVSLVLGACIGSFLNVVIYRWPRNLSIRRPSRSFCPNCQHQIAWYENLPVLSFILLRGRCRNCGQPISLQYPLVEIATALVFLMTCDAFFVARQRLGITDLATDWPMLIGHWVLWAGMIVVAVMDLEAYMVDIRVTWIVSAAGLLAHTVWTPASSIAWIRPDAAGASLAIAATIGLAIGALLFVRVPLPAQEEPEQSGPVDVAVTQTTVTQEQPRVRPSTWLWLVLPAAFVLAYLLAACMIGEQSAYRPASVTLLETHQLGTQPVSLWQDWGATRLLCGFGFAFIALTLAASRPQPQADVEIVEAIHAEASQARPKAMWELKLIGPAVLLGTAALFLVFRSETVAESCSRVLHWNPAGQWQPLWGLSTALFGWIIGGAVGWLCRIMFTLLFGKEALGMGDIHILAAAGAVAGWPVAALGFFAAAPLTLLAVLVIQFRRQSRAVPYGPWLAIAFLLCCIFQDRILAYLGIR